MADAASTPVSVLPALDRTSPMPLWAQLQDAIRRRLSAGEFGSAFPAEQVLQREYDVSRHTVRAALAGLRTEGLVVAERGRGSRVAAAARFEQPLGALYSLFNAVEATGRQQESIVRALDVRRDEDAARRLGLDGDADLVYLERVRLADGEPLAFDRAWLPAVWARDLLTVDFRHTALYTEMLERCGVCVTGGQERLTAVTPSSRERRLLGLSSGGAALQIERLGCSQGRPVEWRTTLVRGDQFAVSATWSPSADYALCVDPDLPALGDRRQHATRNGDSL